MLNRALCCFVAPEELRTGNKSPWVSVKDSKNSSLAYYWNKETNEMTAVGSPKPKHWVEVKDPNGSNLTYWWDQDSNETTALGAPRPNDQLPAQMYTNHQQNIQYDMVPRQHLWGSMKVYFGLGIGMSMAFAVVGALFR